MKAITLHQPAAYVSGVLHGDAWVTNLTLGLRVADKEFCEEFSRCVYSITGYFQAPKIDERWYWLYRAGNKTGRFLPLKEFVPTTVDEQAVWLRGLFDSEGNVQLLHRPRLGELSFQRRVVIHSTETSTLEKAMSYMNNIEIPSYIREEKLTEGHLGSKPVYGLYISGRSGFTTFRDLVGSTLKRKMEVLENLVESYQDITKDAQRKQLLSAASKRNKTMTKTLPSVVKGVADLIRSGIKPQRNCRKIPGYNSIQRYVCQSDLLEMAIKEYNP